MVAKVQALFDKADVEKQYSLETNNIEKDSEAAVQKNAEVIKAALTDQLATGKVGSLTVDPQYLDFEALECKLSNHRKKENSYDSYHPQIRVLRIKAPRRLCSPSSICPRLVYILCWA